MVHHSVPLMLGRKFKDDGTLWGGQSQQRLAFGPLQACSRKPGVMQYRASALDAGGC